MLRRVSSHVDSGDADATAGDGQCPLPALSNIPQQVLRLRRPPHLLLGLPQPARGDAARAGLLRLQMSRLSSDGDASLQSRKAELRRMPYAEIRTAWRAFQIPRSSNPDRQSWRALS